MNGAGETHLLLWSELALTWAVLSYAFPTGTLAEPGQKRPTTKSHILVALRSLIGAVLALALSFSWVLAAATGLTIAAQAERRFDDHSYLLVTELVLPVAYLLLAFGYIDYLDLRLRAVFETAINPRHLAALCVVGAVLLLSTHGGAYIVKCILKTVTPEPGSGGTAGDVGETERKRGFLIGMLERLILIAALTFGSFSALAFLIAAKGLIRSTAFERARSREFTEYVLIGTLASTLLAICAGLGLRYTLMAMWPELLSLKLQSD